MVEIAKEVDCWKREEFGEIEAMKISCLGKIDTSKKKEMLGKLEEAKKTDKVMVV